MWWWHFETLFGWHGMAWREQDRAAALWQAGGTGMAKDFGTSFCVAEKAGRGRRGIIKAKLSLHSCHFLNGMACV